VCVAESVAIWGLWFRVYSYVCVAVCVTVCVAVCAAECVAACVAECVALGGSGFRVFSYVKN